MRNQLFIITVMAVVTVVFMVPGRAVENYVTRNPAGAGTVPMSSIYNGLTGTPNPIDASGNLVITGNVRRGGHFRATVPYESTTSFRADLGSSSLSSFLRDSAGAEDVGRYADAYRVQPYYLRSRTVATTRPGYSGVFRPTDTKINNRTLPSRNFVGMNGTTSGEQQTFFGLNTSTQADNSRELSDLGLQAVQTQYSTSAQKPKIVSSLRELQMLTRSQEDASSQDRQLMVERYRQQTQDVENVYGRESKVPGLDGEQDIAQIYNPLEQFKRSQAREGVQQNKPGFRSEELDVSTVVGESNRIMRELQAQRREETDGDNEQAGYESVIMPGQVYQFQSDSWDSSFTQEKQAESKSGQCNIPSRYEMSSYLPDTEQGQEQGDVLKQLRQQLDDLTKSIEARMKSEEGESDQKATTKAGAYDYRRVPGSDVAGLEFPQTQGQSYQGKQNPLDELNKLSETKISSMAREIRGRHSPESFSQAKFKQHIRAAENYLMAGRYYRAADSFSLASIYKMDDPLCFAGRGHALFAAGEYISSALFLSRALEIAPEYIQADIDLVTMLGGAEKLESRLADVKRWSGKNSSGKLQFLLGYVYYRTGKLEQAKRAIDIAYEKMPDSKAVGVVKKAIEMR